MGCRSIHLIEGLVGLLIYKFINYDVRPHTRVCSPPLKPPNGPRTHPNTTNINTTTTHLSAPMAADCEGNELLLLGAAAACLLLVPPLSSPGSGRRLSGARAQCRRGNAACAIVRCERGDCGSFVVLVIEGMSRMSAAGVAWDVCLSICAAVATSLLLAASNSRAQGTRPRRQIVPQHPDRVPPKLAGSIPQWPHAAVARWSVPSSMDRFDRAARSPPPSSRSIPPEARRRRGAEQGRGAARPFEAPIAAPHRRRRRRATVHACVDAFVPWGLGSAARGGGWWACEGSLRRRPLCVFA